MEIKLLGDRVLVRRLDDKEEEKKGGIIVPDTAKEKPQEGRIIAVGTGKVLKDGKKINLEVEKGNKILFGKYAGTEVNFKGEEYLIMREEDILAILTP